MPEVFTPFIINRTIRNLTFYSMAGRNFVRMKSSLTRRKVLYSPRFKNTRHFAELMGRASKIGSQVYNALPDNWRQGWMYRSFTGEAYTMLKAGKAEVEIQQVLWQRYVSLVVNKKPAEVSIRKEPKRPYRKLNSAYWKNKTLRSNRRKARQQQTLYYAGLMGRASKIASKLYAQLPHKYANRSNYQYLTGLVLKLLKEEISEEDIAATLPCALQPVEKKAVNVLIHPSGWYHFIPPLYVIGNEKFNSKRCNIGISQEIALILPVHPQTWGRFGFDSVDL